MEKITVKEMMKKEIEELESFQTSEEWINYLNIQKNLYNYSFNNCIILKSQNPNVTKVASYKKWKQLGRTVKKGEKALRIYAPIIGKAKKKETKEETKEEEKDVLMGYVLVPVFDISQTEGEDIQDTVDTKGIVSDTIADVIEDITDVPIICTETKNTYVDDFGICISDNLEESRRYYEYIKGYSLYKAKDSSKEEGELIAESVGYIVSSFFDLKTSPYIKNISFMKGDAKKIKEVGSKIQKISKELINKFKENV